MKKRVLMVLTTLSLFVTLAAVSVYAQSDMRLKVNIPFEFSVGNEVLPAGEYTIRHVAQTALVIRSVDCRVAQIFSTIGAQASATRNESTLVFHRYGNEYFLSTIWTAGNAAGHELSKSRAERGLIRARNVLAKSASERQIESLVAHR
jgi:hypothetical protein